MLDEVDAGGGTANAASGTKLPIAKLLTALASMLHEATSRFEATSDHIAELVIERDTGAGPELIVALQDFDRLRQDFVAIGSVLARCAKATHELSTEEELINPPSEVIAEIPLIDFKKRLAQCLDWMSSPGSSPDPAFEEEEIF